MKAIVLRVNSPGGSVTASEVIRSELAAARAAGKPVVVSMGGMAASGGYWISTPASYIVANPSTLTGSSDLPPAVPLPNSPKALPPQHQARLLVRAQV